MRLFADPLAANLYVAGTTLLTSATQGSSWVTIHTTAHEFHAGAFTGGMLLLAGERGLEFAPLVQGDPALRVAIARGPISRGEFGFPNGIWGAGSAGLFSLFPPSNVTGADTPVAGIEAVGDVAGATAGSSNIFASATNRLYSPSIGVLTFPPKP